MCFDSLNASGIFLVNTAYTVHTMMRTMGKKNAIMYDASMYESQTSKLSSRVG